MVQGQHPHTYTQQRRRFDAGRSGPLVEHGYQFLVLSDHNFLTSVDGLNTLLGANQRFLVIRGEEVTDRFADKPLHINGLDLAGVVPPQGGSSVVDVLQRNVDAIRRGAAFLTSIIPTLVGR